MKYTLKILLLYLLLSSCARTETNYPSMFPERKNLQLTKVKEVSSDLLGMPGDIFCLRDYFIIQDEIDNYWYSLIHKKTGELVRYFAPKGRGPQEILYPIDQGHYADDFYVYDSSLETIHIYSLDSLLAHKDNCIVKSIKIHFKNKQYATQCRNLVLLESGEIIANCCHPEGHLVLFDTAGMEKKAFFPEYPYDPLHKEENYIPKSFAFQYNCRIDPKNEKLYNISTTTGHFEIFNLKKDSLERIVNNVYYLPKYENTCSGDNFGVLFKDNTSGLFNPEVTDKYIYAGYKEQPAPHTHMACDVLYRFNLDGTPSVCYNLSNRISRFYVDNETGILYAISSDPVTLEPYIYQAKVE